MEWNSSYKFKNVSIIINSRVDRMAGIIINEESDVRRVHGDDDRRLDDKLATRITSIPLSYPLVRLSDDNGNNSMSTP